MKIRIPALSERTKTMDFSDARDVILAHTLAASPRLCPEIRLRLITPDCKLWRATEEEAAALGLVDPFWAFPWAGGQALARYLLDEPDVVAGKTVLDFGAGGAVEGIAAAMRGATVTIADIDSTAIAAALMNAELNGVTFDWTTEDFLNVQAAPRHRNWDVVLAGDVFYGSDMADRVSRWLAGLTKRGTLVIVGDANRGFLNASCFDKVACFDAPADNDVDGSFMQASTVYALRPR